MLLINWTKGFNRTYWCPHFEGNQDGDLWYIEIRFLRIQFCLYSRYMGNKILDKISKE